MSIPYTLKQLKIIKAIAIEQNFTKASKILHISQPSLSKQIKTLENTLGTPLFKREKNKILLTESGQIFLKYSERILALCEESCRALTDLKNCDRGNLIIGASQTLGTYLVPRVLTVVTQNYPHINFNVQIDSTRIIAKKIVDRNIDIGIVGGYVPREFKKYLKIKNFVEDELVLVTPKLHPYTITNKNLINKDDLYHLNFIALNSNSTIQNFIDTILRQNNIETKKFKIVMELNSIEAIKTAVSLGLGVAFISSSAIEKEIKLETINILKIKNLKIKRTLSLLTNLDFYRSKIFEFFYIRLSSLEKIRRI